MRGERRALRLEATGERLARKLDPERAHFGVAAQLVGFAGVEQRAGSSVHGHRGLRLTDIDIAALRQPHVVAILLELGDVTAVAQHRLRRRQRVGQGHFAESNLANKSVIRALRLRRTFDAQIDLADGVLPGLATFGDGSVLLSKMVCMASSQRATPRGAAALLRLLTRVRRAAIGRSRSRSLALSRADKSVI